jgi:serine/threonine-protein kinase HipA
MHIAYVYIYLAEGAVPAGKLETTGEGREASARFTYGRRYLERPDCVALDPIQLPLIEGMQFTPEHFALFNGIRDAAPDGWGRHLMDRAAGTRPLSEFDYLVATGDSRVGALAFGSDLKGPHRIVSWAEDEEIHGKDLDLPALLAAVNDLDTVEGLPAGHRRFLSRGSSLGGARPKAATPFEGRQWIAKFGRQDDRIPMCRIECTTMQLAAKAGLRVPTVRLEKVLNQDVYLVERFDRIEGRYGERRLPFISGLTILGAHESESSRHSYRELADQIRLYSSSPSQDLHELWRRMVFNILCSNNDDHLRNHGFLWDGSGWRLSPGYDIVSFPQVSQERDLAIGVGRHGRRATIKNALTDIASFGLSREEGVAIAKEMQAIVKSNWEPVSKMAGLAANDIEKLRTCFMACDEVLED